jgi:hypothetical protein
MLDDGKFFIKVVQIGTKVTKIFLFYHSNLRFIG